MRRSRAISMAGVLSLALTLGVAPAFADTEPAPDASPVPEAVDAVGGEADQAAGPDASGGGLPPYPQFERICRESATYLVPEETYPLEPYYDFSEYGGGSYVPTQMVSVDSLLNAMAEHWDFWVADPLGVPFQIQEGTAVTYYGYEVDWYLPYCGEPIHRVSGADRYQVAMNIAADRFKYPDTVYLANGLAYADALAAAPVAAVAGPAPGSSVNMAGPILLTYRDALPPGLGDMIQYWFTPDRVVLLGGTGSISMAVENELRDVGLAVERWAGADRYEVSAEVSSRSFTYAYIAVLAGGLAPADALAVAPLARDFDAPILLTGRDRVPDSVMAELRRLNTGHVYVMGGEGTISSSVVQQLQAEGIEVERLGGADRYDVAAEVSWYIDLYNESETVYVANGLAYADALAIAPVAGMHRNVILLVQKNGIPAATAAALEWIGPEQIVVLGGPGSVSETVFQDLGEYASSVAWGQGVG